MRNILIIIIFTYSSWNFAAKPADLLQAFKDSLRYDPTYQAQVATYRANVQSFPQKFAALLPQVSLSADLQRVYQNIDAIGSGTFNAKIYRLDATQTVFNFTQIKELEQAKYFVQSAFITLCGQQQELMMRTVKAYFEVLRAQEFLEFVKEQKKYIDEQLDASRTLFEHDHATIIELKQAKGARDVINGQLYQAQIDFYNAKQNLSEITSKRYEQFAKLKRDFPLFLPEPLNLDIWLKITNEQNFFLRAERLKIRAAREAMYATEGGFMPNVTANANLFDERSHENFFAPEQHITWNYMGFKANWDVFQGGLTVSQTFERAAQVQLAYANMNRQYLKAMADARKGYTDIVIGKKLVETIRNALQSNRLALQTAQEAYRAGEFTITEVLQIQNQLFSAQKEYVLGVYSYLENYAVLKLAAGTLDIESLAVLNQLLTTTYKK